MFRSIYITLPTLVTLFGIGIAAIMSRPLGIEKHQGLTSCSAMYNLDSIKSMHATWLALETSADTFHVSEAIRLAHRQGIKILLLPSPRPMEPRVEGTDSIRISNANFAQFEHTIMQVAEWAERNEVEAISLGNSILDSSPDTRRWKNLIVKLRGTYRGTLTYFAHPRSELQKVEFWDKLDYIGVAVPISSSPKTTRNGAAAGWSRVQRDVAKVITKFQKPVIVFDITKEASLSNTSAYDLFFEEIWPANWLAGVYIQLPCVTQKDELQYHQETIVRNFAKYEKRH